MGCSKYSSWICVELQGVNVKRLQSTWALVDITSLPKYGGNVDWERRYFLVRVRLWEKYRLPCKRRCRTGKYQTSFTFPEIIPLIYIHSLTRSHTLSLSLARVCCEKYYLDFLKTYAHFSLRVDCVISHLVISYCHCPEKAVIIEVSCKL